MQFAKRFAVTIVGFALLALGGALMVLPGPGVLIIVAGLAVLASEYAWARRLLVRAKAEAEKVQAASVASPARTAGTLLFGVGLAGLGLAMLLAGDVDLPFWGPVTGAILFLTALILLGTTYVLIRAARRRDEATSADFAAGGAGSVRLGAPSQD